MTPRPSAPRPHHFWHSVTTSASPDDIWNVWTNVSEWHLWDKGLQSASLEGSFKLGAVGKLVSLNGTTSRFTITEFNDRRSYTFSTALPFARLNVQRFFESSSKKSSPETRFTHEVWFDGLLGGVFAILLGKNFMRLLPSVMEEVKRLAETRTNVQNAPIDQTL